MKKVIGVDPTFYELVLMVDADTEVDECSLNTMVSFMMRDASIAAICGETRITNERDSWVTMMQVYEYFISHHLAKAFESLFGTVTCLPGCFSLYRIRSANNTPVLASPKLIKGYSENNVNTLHLKNLLHLGEDRYLTTLLLKTFPYMKTKFTEHAKANTVVPDNWGVLISQRRRWINSTVHNLAELLMLKEMCGVFMFSMRFVVFVDLFATLIQPASLLYIVYLVYLAFADPRFSIPITSLVIIGCSYGLQMLIFIIRMEWQHIGWLVFVIEFIICSIY